MVFEEAEVGAKRTRAFATQAYSPTYLKAKL
jgi:hypothetical protein